MMRQPLRTETKVKEFLRPEQLLKSLPLLPGMLVADFGCGNGHYSVAAGAMVGKKGEIFALDIQEEALSRTATLAKLLGLHNILTNQCDLEKLGGSALPDTKCDLVIVSNILHQAENKANLLREAYRVLKTAGKLLLVEWEQDALLGPPPQDRIAKEEIQKLAEQFSFRPVKELPAGAFHYALLYSR